MTCLFLCMLLAAPAVAGEASPQVTHYRAVTATPPAGDAADPAQLAMAADAYERMTVPVRLGPHGPYRFLVDTGSDRTSVSSALARKLGLAERPGAMLHSATGRSAV